jgi:hypothetical protein
MRIKESTAQIIQGLEWQIGIGLVAIGQKMQETVESGLAEYTWTTGHLSDIGAAVMFTTPLLMATKKFGSKLAVALSVPTLLSSTELVQLFSESPQLTFDLQDIGCYYGTALLAWGIKEISESYVGTDVENLEAVVESPKPYNL